MNFETYERAGHAAYEQLAAVVASILEAALTRHNSLRAQQIQHRAKAPESLRRKLDKAQAPDGADIEPFAKDLAGARLIFYTNSDVSGFQNSGILSDNFEVDWERTKIHHPTSENPEASELFVSNNYVVRLKEGRTALPEYAPFAGLLCEVQVQTTLNHAWAEMAHDTIYKKPVLAGFGGQLMKGIEDRMKAIMRDYLAPAGYAFQKVLGDFERLSRGQALFEQGIVAAIGEAADNNELYETLEKFANAVLPYFDDYQAAADEILAAVVEAVKRSRTTPVRVRETPFGNLEGKTSKSVAEKAAAIIRDLRFVSVEHTFAILSDLYPGAHGTDEAAVWIKLASDLAEHNLEIWQQAGPVVPHLLIEQIKALSDAERTNLKPIILPILQHVFATDLTGTTSNFDTITIHQGAVVPSAALRNIRRDALRLAIAYDLAAEEENERAETLLVLNSAMAMPMHGERREPKLVAIVFDNAAEVVRHFISRVDYWSYEQRQKVEHDLLWMYRRYGSAPAPDKTDAQAEEARAAMVSAILEFRDRVNADAGFTTYKLLVGFESVFPPAWDDSEFDYREEETYRAAQMGPLIEGITLENADDWLAIIRRCAATQSNDLATFPTFTTFLEKLAAFSPAIVFRFFEQLDARLANFLPPMLRGLSGTSSWPEALNLLRQWIVERRHLSDIAWSVGGLPALEISVLDSVVDEAIAADDDTAIWAAIRSIAQRDDEPSAAELHSPFMKAVAFMARRNEPRWVNAWLSRRDGSALLATLSQEDLRTVLDSLVANQRIEHRLDVFLADIAQTKPQLVLDHLAKRLERRFSDERERRYDAIPFSLFRLNKVLAHTPDLVVDAMRDWFEEQPAYFNSYGGRLAELAFPQLGAEVEVELGRYLETGDSRDVEFVIEVLRAYSGQVFLQPLLKDAIAALPVNDPLLTRVEIALEPSGVTSGEFGRVKRLRQHRDTMVEWLKDEREAVRDFATRHLRHTDNSISAEQRRSEESLALRRLEYGQENSDPPQEPEDPEEDQS